MTVLTGGVNCVVGAAGSAIGGAASSLGNDIFSSIAQYFADASAAAAVWLWGQLNDATSVDITSAGLQTDMRATASIAAILAVGLFVVQCAASAVRQSMAGLGRAARGMLVAFVGAVIAIAATQLLLGAVDALCTGVVQYTVGGDLQSLGQKLLVGSVAAVGNPSGALLLALVILFAIAMVWGALMVRKLLIIVSAVFAPLAFSGAVADITSGWVKKWIEFTLALVFSKLILVIIFLIGLSVLDGAGQTPGGPTGTGQAAQQITNLVIGALILLLAGLAPWMAIKMVHFTGDSFQHLHAQAAATTAGGQQAAAVPQKVAATAGKFSGGGGAAAQAGTSAATSTPAAGSETTTSKTTSNGESGTPPTAPAPAAGTPPPGIGGSVSPGSGEPPYAGASAAAGGGNGVKHSVEAAGGHAQHAAPSPPT